MNNSNKATYIQTQFDIKDIASAARIMEASKEEIIANTNHQIGYVDMKIVERIQFATQQVEKNVIKEVQRMIKQASEQLKDEILGEMVMNFNRLEGILENLSMYICYLNFNIENIIKDMRIMMETLGRKRKAMKILKKRMAIMKTRLMMKKKAKKSKRIGPQREIERKKMVTKKKRKLKCNEKR